MHLTKKYAKRQPLLITGDSLLALFLFFPAVVCYFRGTWDLITYYVLPGHVPQNFWIMAVVGSLTTLDLCLLPLVENCLKNRSKVTFILVSRLCSIWHGILYIFQWHGYWELANYYGGKDGIESTITLCTLLTTLALMGCLRCVMWPPFFVPLDTRPDLLKVSLRMGSEPQFTVSIKL